MLIFVSAVAVVLIASFLCSIFESVLLSITRPQIEVLVRQGRQAGELLAKFKDNMDAPIAAILILNTAAHTIGAAVAGASYADVFDPGTLWIFSLVFTFAVLLFTEIIPKTLGVNYAQAVEIVEMCESAGITLAVNQNMRYDQSIRACRNVIDRGYLGEPVFASIDMRAIPHWMPWQERLGWVTLRIMSIHHLDTFRFLFGDPQAVYADLRRVNPVISGEDAGYILFDHPDGVRPMFDGNRSLDHNADNLRRTMGEARIEGTDGVLKLSGSGAVSLRKFGARDETLILEPDEHDGFGGDCVHHLQSHVVAAMLGDAPLENTAQDYLRVIEIEEAAYASADEGRKIHFGHT